MLFLDEPFVSAAGLQLPWKIECDALTYSDWETLAKIVAKSFRFKSVEGVPDGGLLFADALDRYVKHTALARLIVDDVLTTGKSMNELKLKYSNDIVIGVVVFARTKDVLTWVTPIWNLSTKLCGE